jgi:acyl carrier protein
MTATDVVALLEEAIQAEPGKLQPASTLEGLDGWDSMGMVLFMGLVQERAGIELSVYDVRGCATPAAIARLIEERRKK